MTGHVKTQKMSASQLEKLARSAIEEARKQAGLSRSALARKIPVESKTVERWEKGRTGGAMENLRSIAACLNTTTDQLLAAAAAQGRPTQKKGDLSDALSEAEPASAAKVEQMLQEVLDQQAQLLAEVSEVRAAQERWSPLLERLSHDLGAIRKDVSSS